MSCFTLAALTQDYITLSHHITSFSVIYSNFSYFPVDSMPAFRQVGEKQLPNPVLCMAWSPKRDLIALANTTGEVGLKIVYVS